MSWGGWRKQSVARLLVCLCDLGPWGCCPVCVCVHMVHLNVPANQEINKQANQKDKTPESPIPLLFGTHTPAGTAGALALSLISSFCASHTFTSCTYPASYPHQNQTTKKTQAPCLSEYSILSSSFLLCPLSVLSLSTLSPASILTI